MDAVVWSDYICPWCYLGTDRTHLLIELGVPVTVLPYELHPEIPPGGQELRSGRVRALYERLKPEFERAGLPFTAPARTPNSRLALETAEWVRRNQSEAFATLHHRLFAAHFAEGLDIGSSEVVEGLLDEAGVDTSVVAEAIGSGLTSKYLAEARQAAIDSDVVGTPSWKIGALVVPGVQPREFFARVVSRLRPAGG